jgi:hypothetical protein
MRAVVLLVLGSLTLLAACQKSAEDAAEDGVVQAPAVSGQAAQAPAADAPPPVVETDVAAAPVSGDVPAGWPAGAPFYPGSTVISGSSADGPDGTFFNAWTETPDALEQVAAFYAEAARTHGGGGGYEETRSPDSVHYGYLIEEGKFDAFIQSQPSKTTIQLDVTPRMGDEELLPMVSWIGLGEAPPGFPLELLPPGAGGTIEEAMTINDETYVLAVATQTPPDGVLRVYDEHFAARGWTVAAGSGEMAGRHTYESAEGKIVLDAVAFDDVTRARLSYETVEFMERRAARGEQVSEVP